MRSIKICVKLLNKKKIFQSNSASCETQKCLFFSSGIFKKKKQKKQKIFCNCFKINVDVLSKTKQTKKISTKQSIKKKLFQ